MMVKLKILHIFLLLISIIDKTVSLPQLQVLGFLTKPVSDILSPITANTTILLTDTNQHNTDTNLQTDNIDKSETEIGPASNAPDTTGPQSGPTPGLSSPLSLSALNIGSLTNPVSAILSPLSANTTTVLTDTNEHKTDTNSQSDSIAKSEKKIVSASTAPDTPVPQSGPIPGLTPPLSLSALNIRSLTNSASAMLSTVTTNVTTVLTDVKAKTTDTNSQTGSATSIEFMSIEPDVIDLQSTPTQKTTPETIPQQTPGQSPPQTQVPKPEQIPELSAPQTPGPSASQFTQNIELLTKPDILSTVTSTNTSTATVTDNNQQKTDTNSQRGFGNMFETIPSQPSSTTTEPKVTNSPAPQSQPTLAPPPPSQAAPTVELSVKPEFTQPLTVQTTENTTNTIPYKPDTIAATDSATIKELISSPNTTAIQSGEPQPMSLQPQSMAPQPQPMSSQPQSTASQPQPSGESATKRLQTTLTFTQQTPSTTPIVMGKFDRKAFARKTSIRNQLGQDTFFPETMFDNMF